MYLYVIIDMQGFKSKILYLSFGLVIGLLIGGSFFIFKLDEFFKDFDEQTLYENLAARIEKLYDKQTDELLIEEEKQASEQISIVEKRESELVESSKGDTLQKDTTQMGWQLNEGVELAEVLAIDSLLDDDFPDLVEASSSEEIIVKKDELLSTRFVNINDLNEKEDRSKLMKDSLLVDLSGVQENKKAGTYLVEFWQSPLNYRGYKMAKNKIVLFGINQPEDVKIYQLEDQIYMKYLDKVYRVVLTNEFEQLEMVADEYVLMQIKG